MKTSKPVKFKWLGRKYNRVDKLILDKNYKFYSKCFYHTSEFSIGKNVQIEYQNCVNIGVIQYFYEDPNASAFADRYRVAVELYLKPEEIEDKIEDSLSFDYDLEIIKQNKSEFQNFPIESLKSICLVIYGLVDETPKELINEVPDKDCDLIYACRYLAIENKTGMYQLLSVVMNEVNKLDETEENEEQEETNVEHSPYEIKERNSLRVVLQRKSSNVLNDLQLNAMKPVVVLDRLPLEKERVIEDSIKKNDKEPKRTLRKSTQFDLSRTSTPIVKKPSGRSRKVNKSARLMKKVSTTSRPSINSTPSDSNSEEYKLESSSDSSSSLSSSSLSKSSSSYESSSSLPIVKTKRLTRLTKKRSKRISLRNGCSSSKRSTVTKSPVKRANENGGDFGTPSKTKRIALKNLTPSIQERTKRLTISDTPMQKARFALSTTNSVMKLSCRENEYVEIFNFVTSRLIDNTSGCMYISGVPGTGKTMTVCRVMADLIEQKCDSVKCTFIKLNALSVTEPRQIYVDIIKHLMDKTVHWEEALNMIQSYFSNKNKKQPHVILIDELDKLCNKKQDVVYNLLDLPFNSSTPLILITIANTMDLPERILSNKVNSRLGLIRLTFKPYQYKDLVEIVSERLSSDKVFKAEALELIARKVAAVSGDARRALAMCSRATEFAEELDQDHVNMSIIDKVVNEMSNTSNVNAIKCCSKLSQRILMAVSSEVLRTGNEEVPFNNMYENLVKLCILENWKQPAVDLCLRDCLHLGSYRLLITQHGKTDVNMTLMLNVSTDDIHFALQ